MMSNFNEKGKIIPRVRFLESRDEDFSTSRSFLVLCMIILHVFQQLYNQQDYNSLVTGYIFIGFVFLAGFTGSVIYAENVKEAPSRFFIKYLTSCIKILVVFFICNGIVLLIDHQRLNILAENHVRKALISILVGDQQNVFALDVLIPISFTMLSSWALMALPIKPSWLCVAFVFLISVVYIEMFNVMNFYGIKLLFIGLIGSSIGIYVHGLEWQNFIERMIKVKLLVFMGAFIFVYFMMAYLLWKPYTTPPYSLKVVPIVVILFFVYAVSKKWDITRNKLISLFNQTLSKYMFFAYIYHILLINILIHFLPRRSLGLSSTLYVGILTVAATVVGCQILDFLNREFPVFKKFYRYTLG